MTPRKLLHRIGSSQTNVRYSDLVRLLRALEQSPHVLKIKRLHLKTRYSDPNYLDAVFLLSSYEKA